MFGLKRSSENSHAGFTQHKISQSEIRAAPKATVCVPNIFSNSGKGVTPAIRLTKTKPYTAAHCGHHLSPAFSIKRQNRSPFCEFTAGRYTINFPNSTSKSKSANRCFKAGKVRQCSFLGKRVPSNHLLKNHKDFGLNPVKTNRPSGFNTLDASCSTCVSAAVS